MQYAIHNFHIAHARGREAVGVGPHFSQPKVVFTLGGTGRQDRRDESPFQTRSASGQTLRVTTVAKYTCPCALPGRSITSVKVKASIKPTAAAPRGHDPPAASGKHGTRCRAAFGSPTGLWGPPYAHGRGGRFKRTHRVRSRSTRPPHPLQLELRPARRLGRGQMCSGPSCPPRALSALTSHSPSRA